MAFLLYLPKSVNATGWGHRFQRTMPLMAFEVLALCEAAITESTLHVVGPSLADHLVSSSHQKEYQ